MKRVAHPGSWLPVARPRAWSPSLVCHARFYSPPAQDKESIQNSQNSQNSQLQHEDDLEFKDWAEINPQDKTVQTAIGALPISPLLDPSWQKARQRGPKKAKPPPTMNMSRVRRNLYNNPYARMLSEPVRMCQLTKARLPQAFLQSFGLARKPKSDENWWISADVASDAKKLLNSSFKHGSPKKKKSNVRARQIEGKLNAVLSDKKRILSYTNLGKSLSNLPLACEDEEEDPTPTPVQVENFGRRNAHFRTPVHVLARQDLLASFHDRNSKYGGGHMRFAGHPSIGGLANNSVWRKDMHDAIAERLRFDIVAQLICLAEATAIRGLMGKTLYIHRPMRQLRKPASPEMAEEKAAKTEKPLRIRGYPLARLQVSDPEVEDREGDEACTATLSPPFTPFTLANNSIPTYHLPSLLGIDFMKTLIAKSPGVFKPQAPEDQWVTLQGNMALDVAAKLWRLQGFVADYEKLQESERKKAETEEAPKS